MKRFVAVFFFIIFLPATIWAQATADQCKPSPFGLTHDIWENKNERVLEIFQRLLPKVDLEGLEMRFILCETKLPTMPVPQSHSWNEGSGFVRATIIPYEVANEFSEDELTGVIAHELAHIIKGPLAGTLIATIIPNKMATQIAFESQTDMRAADWIGVSKMIMAHQAFKKLALKYYTNTGKWSPELLLESLRLRILVLEARQRGEKSK